MKPLRLLCAFAVAATVAGVAHAQTPVTRPALPANIAPPPLPPASAPASAPEPAAGSAAKPAPPPVPAPLEEYRGGTDDEPQVTIVRRETETVEEVRVAGVLRYVRVTPRHGVPYYLVPSGSGQLMRQDSLGTGLSVPMWLLFSW